MMELLHRANIDQKEIRIIQNLYWNQMAKVRIDQDQYTDEFEIRKGVRQGCILSPMLFNLNVENIFAEALEDTELGIKVNGIPISNLRYADDTVIITDKLEDQQLLLDRVNSVGKKYGLKINILKTKYMVISRNSPEKPIICIGDDRIKRVKTFKYLGTTINDQSDPQQEIKTRIQMARQAFVKFRPLLCNQNLHFEIRYRMVKCYIWSILLYGMETWTLKKTSINKLEAFEMWSLRRMMRIPWVDRVRNDDVLKRAGVERELFKLIKKRKIGYLGHILRGAKYEIPQLILQGKIEGRRGAGRKQLSWLRNIKEWTGIHNTGELCHAAKNRILVMR
ncbi:putative uncharacterized transposon-derived protein F52C9.6 isoform X1 [Diabrotica undecimpunctata]|uniref:putative uncharacterized transposon-derived protein F52C9.6 isoform X1 n=1 Tax=Diabrotica undecimpunctata TaxID=50387 RepID=UPI003B63C9BB